MFCKKCGTKQGVGDKFCRKCGTLYMILENDIVIQTVNDDLSNNEIENNIRVEEEESNQVRQIQSCFSSKDGDESKLETPLVRDDEVMNNAKIHFTNKNEDANVKQSFTSDNTFIKDKQSEYQAKANKIKMLTRIIAIASCLIFFVLKAGFSVSIWWWSLVGVILCVAFKKIDDLGKQKIVGQAKNYLYLCITLSSVLLLLGPNKNDVYGDNIDGSNADNIENSYSNQNIENIKVKILSLSQENESLMKGMMRDYSYFEEQLHSFGRDISSSTYQSITKKRNQILENLNEIERLANSIGITDYSSDVERLRLSTEKSYKSILDKYGW